MTFVQSREGFRALVDRITSYVPLEQCCVLMERTGHYHQALEQYLLELGISVFSIHVQRRPSGILKSDKRDALSLANYLFNHLERGIQVADKLHLVRWSVASSQAASQLKGLTHHRLELIQESTQRKNKLIALCDELFPEFIQVCKDPNLPSALALREHFATPQAITTASLAALREVRVGKYPSDAKLVLLQESAAESIGTKEVLRQHSLVLEQQQLIKELKLLQEHLEQLDTEITRIVEQAREGKILLSMQIGPISAATIIASIGHIANFESAAAFKSYFGWAPAVE